MNASGLSSVPIFCKKLGSLVGDPDVCDTQGSPSLHSVFTIQAFVWASATGVLDVLREAWEEGPTNVKNEIQFVLDLRVKLHTLRRFK